MALGRPLRRHLLLAQHVGGINIVLTCYYTNVSVAGSESDVAHVLCVKQAAVV